VVSVRVLGGTLQHISRKGRLLAVLSSLWYISARSLDDVLPISATPVLVTPLVTQSWTKLVTLAVCRPVAARETVPSTVAS